MENISYHKCITNIILSIISIGDNMNNNEEGAKKMLDYNNIPVGLSMALAQNTGALEHFAKMIDSA